MPRIACCAMARMIDEGYFLENLKNMETGGKTIRYR
jgi:quinolinate synthase